MGERCVNNRTDVLRSLVGDEIMSKQGYNEYPMPRKVDDINYVL